MTGKELRMIEESRLKHIEEDMSNDHWLHIMLEATERYENILNKIDTAYKLNRQVVILTSYEKLLLRSLLNEKIIEYGNKIDERSTPNEYQE